MSRIATGFLSTLVLVTASAHANQFIIHAGRIVDVTKGRIMEDVSIVIRDDRITAVSDGFKAPAGDQTIIDLREHTVMPGLMDMHTHLSTVISQSFFMEKFVMDSADYAFRAVSYAEKTLLAGFTTVRDLGDQIHVMLHHNYGDA